MENVITELAKYMILLLTALYTYLGFAVFRKKKERERVNIYRGQTFLILAIHLVGYLLLYMQNRETKLLWLYLAQLLVLVLSGIFYRKLYRNFSTVLFLHMQFFLMTGFVFLTRLSFESSVKQTIFAGVSLFICLSVPYLIGKFTFLPKMSWIYALLGIVLLLWVQVAGKEVYGATNWIVIKGVGFQPSEFVKILYVFMLAAFLAKRNDLRQVILVSVLAAAHVLLLVAGRDLGGALIFYVTYVIVLFVATKSYVYLLAGIGGGVAASVAAYQLFSHVRVRVLAWRDPWSYIDREGYQVTQSLFGIGTGGWFGMGLGKGLPTSIPVVKSDFIFSGISEELGGFFAICLILIYLGSFLLFIQLAWRMRNRFHQYIAVGCCVVYSFQVFLCIGGAIKLIPSTGVTLPLISYGGSSMIATILMFSIVQGLYVCGNRTGKSAGRNVGQYAGGASASLDLPKNTDRTSVVTYGFLTLFVFLLVYFSYFIGFEGKQVINNAYNKRQDLFANQVLRGEILAADGTCLAYSKEREDGSVERIYPYTDLYSHFVGRESNGKTGVESMINFELLTSNDQELRKLSEKLSGERNRGDRAVTTIDTVLQTAADKALSGYRGAAVVLEPSTGKILAMVSKPDYDPNTVAEDWGSLTGELESESRLLNRATNGLYPPGSTFKVLTALEYMRENPKYQKDRFECNGTFVSGDYQIQCYNRKAHGEVDLTKAFAVSCNTYFASRGLKLDRTSFAALADEMLFNRELPAFFPHKGSSFSLTEESGADETMQTMIGQGKTQITPLHNAMIAAAIANGGVLMKPYAVDRLEVYDGSHVVKKYWPETAGELMTAEEAKLLTDMMEEVVIHGSAKLLTGYPFEVYGKTGTAEYIAPDGRKDAHSWFIGFTDWDGKQIAVSVILEGEGRGNRTANEVTVAILSAWKNTQKNSGTGKK